MDFKAFCGKYDSFFDIEGELNSEFDISLISDRDRNIVLSIIKDIKPKLYRVKMSYIQSAITNLTLDEFNELFEKSGDIDWIFYEYSIWLLEKEFSKLNKDELSILKVLVTYTLIVLNK